MNAKIISVKGITLAVSLSRFRVSLTHAYVCGLGRGRAEAIEQNKGVIVLLGCKKGTDPKVFTREVGLAAGEQLLVVGNPETGEDFIFECKCGKDPCEYRVPRLKDHAPEYWAKNTRRGARPVGVAAAWQSVGAVPKKAAGSAK